MDNQKNNINSIDEKQIIEAIEKLKIEIIELKSKVLEKEMLIDELTKQTENFK